MTASKIVAAAASSVGDSTLDVDDVFSPYLYSGSGSSQAINNGIDLAGKGGLVWGKGRTNIDGHYLVDSERGIGSNNNFKYLRAENTGAEIDLSIRSISSFNSNGFTFQAADAQFNASGEDYVTWTFRKAEKFFDVVTYSGQNTDLALSHNLGAVPGMVIVKRTDATGDWYVWHRSINQSENLTLNSSGDVGANNFWTSTAPSSTVFNLAGDKAATNQSGGTYVAYLFAHNNGDGTFGPDEDQDIIKCGTYTGNSTDQEINLGFEPQWIIIKGSSSSGRNWGIFDTQRFWFDQKGAGDSKWLIANSTAAEAGIARFYPKFDGFGFTSENGDHMNSSGNTYVYMAIRKGPLAEPEAASEVFNIATATAPSGADPQFISGFKTDFALYRPSIDSSSQYTRLSSRLTGERRLYVTANDSEATDSEQVWDYETGHRNGGANSSYYSWMWKRAPKFCDVVAWNGTGSNRTIGHNLGVVPEMMWVKIRNGSYNWRVYHKDMGNTKYLQLDTADQASTHPNAWNDTTPTSSVFTLGTGQEVNRSGDYWYVGYLFATLAGISKVGSVTATGNTINVDCGFTNGAKFILMKRTDSTTAGWLVWDSVRGIVAGNDPYLINNSTDAQITNTDYIDPLSSGFTLTDSFYSAGTWIFYAVAA